MAEYAVDPANPGVQKVDVTGIVRIEETIEAPDAREGVLRFLTANPDADVEKVGTRKLIALAVGSGRPILDGDLYKFNREEAEYELLSEVNGLGENEQIYFDEGEGDAPFDAADSDPDAPGGNLAPY